jgi:hypothetical protein
MSSLMLAGVSSAETPQAGANARRSPAPGSQHRIIKPASDTGWQSVNSGTSATSMRAADLRTPVEAINAVEETLQRYEAAFDSMSLGSVHQVWPSLDRQRDAALNEVFSFFKERSLTPALELSCQLPTVDGKSARLLCQESLSYTDPKGKRTEVKPAKISISLVEVSGNWVVESMRGL